MTIPQAERPLTSDIVKAVAKRLRRAVEDFAPSLSLASIADELNLSHTKVEEWVKETGAHWPVYSLASRRAVPDRLFARIIADIESVRAHQSVVTVTAEGAATGVLTRAGAAISEIARALSDGRITSLEAVSVRHEIAQLESECARLRRSLDHIETSGVQ